MNPPIVVTGIYRSGTTLLARLVQSMGVDFGPAEHSLQGKGHLGHLNPDGFHENFLMNDLGRYILYCSGGSGVEWPEPDKISQLHIQNLDDADFKQYSRTVLKDTRIDNSVREDVLDNYNLAELKQYFLDFFNTSFWGFKDVHAGVYLDLYREIWPGARIVCSVRHPAAFLKSALKLTKHATTSIWVEYYQRVIDNDAGDIMFVCFEELLAGNHYLVQALARFLEKDISEKEAQDILEDLVDVRKVHYEDDQGVSKVASLMYKALKLKCLKGISS